MTSYIIVTSASFLTTFASFFLKKSTAGKENLFQIIFGKFFIIGAFMYVIQASLSIYALRRDELPYSVIVPLGALTYIWTLFVSKRFLNESINKRKIMAVVIIFCGIIMVSI